MTVPSFATPQFQEFFRLGRVLRTTLPTSRGGVVHLFVVYGYQGAEEDADQLQLTDKLLQTVLAEAQVVWIGQPMLISGDFNADPAVIHCLSKGISAGRYVDLALAYSLGAGLAPDATCRFPGALAASQACYVTDLWFTPHLSVLARFRIGAWMADVACPIACQPIWPACWLDTPRGSSSSSTSAVRGAVSRSSVDDFWSIWSRGAEEGLFRAYSRAGGPTVAGSSAFLGRGLLRIRNRRLGGRAAVVQFLVGCIELVRVMMLMFIVLSTLFIPLFLLCFFSVDVFCLWQMFLKVSGVRGSLRLGGMLF